MGTRIHEPGESTPSSSTSRDSQSNHSRLALLGNPNTGKTTLFNRLCGVRSKTANFPGSTVEARVGSRTFESTRYELVDLPGHYGLNLDRPESRLCRDYLTGHIDDTDRPDGIVIVADATNLSRNLILISQALQQDLPAVVALNMIDLAQKGGLTIDVEKLSEHLGCPVVPMCARTGEGVDELLKAMGNLQHSDVNLPDPTNAQTASVWADEVVSRSVGGHDAVGSAGDTFTDRLDMAFTHPVIGLLVFITIMTGLFWTIFALATLPMDLIELIFSWLGNLVGGVLPEGAIKSLITDGVIAGIAGVVVFLPQICILFFLLSLLEDTGYLARAAFVTDRVLRRFGLPGQAFVPLLSAHACAIPAIMSARLIPDHRDRLATILVAPFMSCSARVPVYVLVIGMLFGDNALYAGLAFTGCYVLGALAALISSLIFRRTFLKGPSRPMILELPTYKMPSITSALLTTYDRALVFLKNAGTVIVAICIVLWWLGEYPHVPPPAEATAIRAQAELVETEDPAEAQALIAKADIMEARHAKSSSFMGRIGKFAEPVFEPIGYDWQLTIGVLSSLLAREVFVSTMSVVFAGMDEDPAEDETVRQRIVGAKRADGTLLFTTPVAASLLVFYVLAMQCLPTLAVTRRETGSWNWAIFQFVYMSGLAYVFSLITYHGLIWMGVT
ncbi:MAG: ferrous iron transporter B [Planctomycetota bacterium]|nr:ferrous iron transporter B [Planctomycetota bacterium]